VNDLMMIRAEKMARHSRRFYLRLCAFCDAPVGLATGPSIELRTCEHTGALLSLARERLATLGRPRVETGECDPAPDPDRPPRRTGRARSGGATRLVVAA
jgi:hypothetical protein